MRIGRGNRSTRRKTAPVSFCSPQIPYDLTRARTRAAAVGIRLLTASAMGRAIAQAVSRWLPTAAARVRARVWSSEIFGGQSGAGSGFPLPIFIPPTSPSS
jgi:hypothetical protein